MSVINVSCYKFVTLDELHALKQALTARCMAVGLKGTILLAPEGINVFLAGERRPIEAFFDGLREDPRFADLQPKKSVSNVTPFKRLRVRIKKEIITMKLPLLRPEAQRAPAVNAATLKRWLDQGVDDAGREVVMLDTRNDYEVAEGRFRGALDYRLARFSDFPERFAQHRAALADKTVVSYCTGGIRCEKAALHMQHQGLSHVYQLEGGILKYFEEAGGAHFQGRCFVFDERYALDANLRAVRELRQGQREPHRQPAETHDKKFISAKLCGNAATA